LKTSFHSLLAPLFFFFCWEDKCQYNICSFKVHLFFSGFFYYFLFNFFLGVCVMEFIKSWERKIQREHGGTQVESAGWESILLLFRCF
jgi:hypothetical protein